MNARQYIEYIGLSDNYESETAASKISIIQKLLMHYENDASKNVLWAVLKLAFKPFPKSKIPDFFLKSKYNGPFLYTSAHTANFRSQCISRIEDEIEQFNKTGVFLEEKLKEIKEIGNYNILDCTYIKDDFNDINRKNHIVITGYRKGDPAIKNNPTIKVFIRVLDNEDNWVILRNI